MHLVLQGKDVDDLKEIQTHLDEDLTNQKVQHFWHGFEVAK